MTPAQDRRATTAQEEAWHATPFHRAMMRSLAEQGYPSYAEAVALRVQPHCPEAEKARWQAFQDAWRVRACRYAKLPHDRDRAKGQGPHAKAGPSRTSGYVTHAGATVRRKAADPEPLAPAILRECRQRLDEAMRVGMGRPGRPSQTVKGRRRGPDIKVGVEAGW